MGLADLSNYCVMKLPYLVVCLPSEGQDEFLQITGEK